ncbi:bifunctional diguanylate cyclase/phosphodiesterase [Sporosarcina beigongshangi]|uniref:bifunctional diguanylate cyclase/phosphodiesterase n=1 Tax=Sporosarcina beigongshangi TaxID=2782538 RepID=UPI00193AAE15|nr:EAL domain-containing protein [Sporosarcina beigongshangi]
MKLGINGKVVIAMLVVVLSTMLTIAFYSHSMTKAILIDQVERELAIKNDNVKDAVSSVFEQKGEIVHQLASIPVIESFMSTNEKRENVRSNKDYDWIQKALVQAKENNEDVNMVWLAHTKNSYYVANDDYVTDALYFIEERPWFKKALENEGLAFSSPYIDYTTNQLTISITYPVIVEKEQLGYLGVDIHLDGLADLLEPLETDGQKVALVSDQGDILYDPGEIWKTIRDIPLKEEEILRLQTDEGIHFASVRQLDELGWKIAVYIPEEVVLAPLTKYERSIFISWTIAILVLLTTLSFVLHYLLKDIPFIVRQINKIKDGDLSIKMGMKRKDEVGEIAHAVEQMAQQIKNQVEELDYQASYDSLTSLANRNSIEKTMQQWLDEMNTDKEMMAVTFLDLDQFKHVNDSKGHVYGDELLIEVGKRIGEMLPKTSFFGRFGGDEFVLIMRAEKEDVDYFDNVLQRIHESFMNPFLLFGQHVYITASMGVSLYPTDAKTIGELLIDADTALYHAKEQGRNCISFFNNDMKGQIEKELKLKDGLRQALLNEEFFLHYQPQLDISSGETTGVEALIRWKHPELGMVSPAEFIPLAESTGQIITIGDWVLDASLQMIKRLAKEDVTIQRVAVNVSALQLREADFVQKVQKKLAYYDVEPSFLEIEITESVIINYQEETIQKLEELKRLGIHIALDDFGTGYSSLNYLRLMPIDCVKVDRSFIHQIEEDPIVQAILQTIITLGQSLGFHIVAEGVEEEAQLQILRNMNVDTVQGYYYSRPLDEEKLLDFLQE